MGARKRDDKVLASASKLVPKRFLGTEHLCELGQVPHGCRFLGCVVLYAPQAHHRGELPDR